MKKTPNILIRQTTKRGSKQSIPSLHSATSLHPKTDLKQNNNISLTNINSITSASPNVSISVSEKVSNQENIRPEGKTAKNKQKVSTICQISKEMMRAETVSQTEQAQICEEVRRTVGKKVKGTELRIQSDMISYLEGQCQKLGQQLQAQKHLTQSLRHQIQKLRQNIQNLNIKYQKVSTQNSSLSKHHQDNLGSNRQLTIQINKLKQKLANRQQELQICQLEKNNSLERSNAEIKYLGECVKKMEAENGRIKGQLEAMHAEVKAREAELVEMRELMAKKEAGWDMQRKEMESALKTNMQKKGQKITKYQSDSLKLQQKLTQQQQCRKKLSDRNKQLQKLAIQSSEQKQQLQQTIISLKKRVNDLGILKSSNNTIMNQKIAALNEENQKLRAEVEELRGGRSRGREQMEKPVLFGAGDFQ